MQSPSKASALGARDEGGGTQNQMSRASSEDCSTFSIKVTHNTRIRVESTQGTKSNFNRLLYLDAVDAFLLSSNEGSLLLGSPAQMSSAAASSSTSSIPEHPDGRDSPSSTSQQFRILSSSDYGRPVLASYNSLFGSLALYDERWLGIRRADLASDGSSRGNPASDGPLFHAIRTQLPPQLDGEPLARQHLVAVEMSMAEALAWQEHFRRVQITSVAPSTTARGHSEASKSNCSGNKGTQDANAFYHCSQLAEKIGKELKKRQKTSGPSGGFEEGVEGDYGDTSAFATDTTIVVQLPWRRVLQPLLRWTHSMEKKVGGGGSTQIFPHAFSLLERIRLQAFSHNPYASSSTSTISSICTVEASKLNVEAARLLTFHRWPHTDYKWALPPAMAEAGFYHSPDRESDDRVLCFACGLGLVSWEPGDDPRQEHERHANQKNPCPYINGIGGEDLNVPRSLTMAHIAPIQWRENSAGNLIEASATPDARWFAVGVNDPNGGWGTSSAEVRCMHLDRVVQQPLVIHAGMDAFGPEEGFATEKKPGKPAGVELTALCCMGHNGVDRDGLNQESQASPAAIWPDGTTISAALLLGVTCSFSPTSPSYQHAEWGSGPSQTGISDEVSSLNTLNASLIAAAAVAPLVEAKKGGGKKSKKEGDKEDTPMQQDEHMQKRQNSPYLLLYHILESKRDVHEEGALGIDDGQHGELRGSGGSEEPEELTTGPIKRHRRHTGASGKPTRTSTGSVLGKQPKAGSGEGARKRSRSTTTATSPMATIPEANTTTEAGDAMEMSEPQSNAAAEVKPTVSESDELNAIQQEVEKIRAAGQAMSAELKSQQTFLETVMGQIETSASAEGEQPSSKPPVEFKLIPVDGAVTTYPVKGQSNKSTPYVKPKNIPMEVGQQFSSEKCWVAADDDDEPMEMDDDQSGGSGGGGRTAKLTQLNYAPTKETVVAMQCIRLPLSMGFAEWRIGPIVASDSNVVVAVNRLASESLLSNCAEGSTLPSSVLLVFKRIQHVSMVEETPIATHNLPITTSIAQMIALPMLGKASMRGKSSNSHPTGHAEDKLGFVAVRLADGNTMLVDLGTGRCTPLFDGICVSDMTLGAARSVNRAGRVSMSAISSDGTIHSIRVSTHLAQLSKLQLQETSTDTSLDAQISPMLCVLAHKHAPAEGWASVDQIINRAAEHLRESAKEGNSINDALTKLRTVLEASPVGWMLGPKGRVASEQGGEAVMKKTASIDESLHLLWALTRAKLSGAAPAAGSLGAPSPNGDAELGEGRARFTLHGDEGWLQRERTMGKPQRGSARATREPARSTPQLTITSGERHSLSYEPKKRVVSADRSAHVLRLSMAECKEAGCEAGWYGVSHFDVEVRMRRQNSTAASALRSGKRMMLSMYTLDAEEEAQQQESQEKAGGRSARYKRQSSCQPYQNAEKVKEIGQLVAGPAFSSEEDEEGDACIHLQLGSLSIEQHHRRRSALYLVLETVEDSGSDCPANEETKEMEVTITACDWDTEASVCNSLARLVFLGVSGQTLRKTLLKIATSGNLPSQANSPTTSLDPQSTPDKNSQRLFRQCLALDILLWLQAYGRRLISPSTEREGDGSGNNENALLTECLHAAYSGTAPRELAHRWTALLLAELLPSVPKAITSAQGEGDGADSRWELDIQRKMPQWLKALADMFNNDDLLISPLTRKAASFHSLCTLLFQVLRIASLGETADENLVEGDEQQGSFVSKGMHPLLARLSSVLAALGEEWQRRVTAATMGLTPAALKQLGSMALVLGDERMADYPNLVLEMRSASAEESATNSGGSSQQLQAQQPSTSAAAYPPTSNYYPFHSQIPAQYSTTATPYQPYSAFGASTSSSAAGLSQAAGFGNHAPWGVMADGPLAYLATPQQTTTTAGSTAIAILPAAFNTAIQASTAGGFGYSGGVGGGDNINGAGGALIPLPSGASHAHIQIISSPAWVGSAQPPIGSSSTTPGGFIPASQLLPLPPPSTQQPNTQLVAGASPAVIVVSGSTAPGGSYIPSASGVPPIPAIPPPMPSYGQYASISKYSKHPSAFQSGSKHGGGKGKSGSGAKGQQSNSKSSSSAVPPIDSASLIGSAFPCREPAGEEPVSGMGWFANANRLQSKWAYQPPPAIPTQPHQQQKTQSKRLLFLSCQDYTPGLLESISLAFEFSHGSDYMRVVWPESGTNETCALASEPTQPPQSTPHSWSSGKKGAVGLRGSGNKAGTSAHATSEAAGDEEDREDALSLMSLADQHRQRCQRYLLGRLEEKEAVATGAVGEVEQMATPDSNSSLQPPSQMKRWPLVHLVADRMTAGTRKYVVLDFGRPILLTGLLLPACEYLSRMEVDVWCAGETVDCVHLMDVGGEIALRSFIVSPIEPAGVVARYVRLSFTSKKLFPQSCTIPIGRFFGVVQPSPWQLLGAINAGAMRGENAQGANEDGPTSKTFYMGALRKVLVTLRAKYARSSMRLREFMSTNFGSTTPLAASPLPGSMRTMAKPLFRRCFNDKLELNLCLSELERLEWEDRSGMAPDTTRSTPSIDQLKMAASSITLLLNQISPFLLHSQSFISSSNEVAVIGDDENAMEVDGEREEPREQNELLTLASASSLFTAFILPPAVPDTMRWHFSRYLLSYGGGCTWWPELFPHLLGSYFTASSLGADVAIPSSSEMNVVGHEPTDFPFLLLTHLCIQSPKEVVPRVVEHLVGYVLKQLEEGKSGSGVDVHLLSWTLQLLVSIFDSNFGGAGNGDNNGDNSASRTGESKENRWAFLMGDLSLAKKRASRMDGDAWSRPPPSFRKTSASVAPPPSIPPTSSGAFSYQQNPSVKHMGGQQFGQQTTEALCTKLYKKMTGTLEKLQAAENLSQSKIDKMKSGLKSLKSVLAQQTAALKQQEQALAQKQSEFEADKVALQQQHSIKAITQQDGQPSSSTASSSALGTSFSSTPNLHAMTLGNAGGGVGASGDLSWKTPMLPPCWITKPSSLPTPGPISAPSLTQASTFRQGVATPSKMKGLDLPRELCIRFVRECLLAVSGRLSSHQALADATQQQLPLPTRLLALKVVAKVIAHCPPTSTRFAQCILDEALSHQGVVELLASMLRMDESGDCRGEEAQLLRHALLCTFLEISDAEEENGKQAKEASFETGGLSQPASATQLAEQMVDSRAITECALSAVSTIRSSVSFPALASLGEEGGDVAGTSSTAPTAESRSTLQGAAMLSLMLHPSAQHDRRSAVRIAGADSLTRTQFGSCAAYEAYRQVRTLKHAMGRPAVSALLPQGRASSSRLTTVQPVGRAMSANYSVRFLPNSSPSFTHQTVVEALHSLIAEWFSTSPTEESEQGRGDAQGDLTTPTTTTSAGEESRSRMLEPGLPERLLDFYWQLHSQVPQALRSREPIPPTSVPAAKALLSLCARYPLMDEVVWCQTIRLLNYSVEEQPVTLGKALGQCDDLTRLITRYLRGNRGATTMGTPMGMGPTVDEHFLRFIEQLLAVPSKAISERMIQVVEEMLGGGKAGTSKEGRLENIIVPLKKRWKPIIGGAIASARWSGSMDATIGFTEKLLDASQKLSGHCSEEQIARLHSLLIHQAKELVRCDALGGSHHSHDAQSQWAQQSAYGGAGLDTSSANVCFRHMEGESGRGNGQYGSSSDGGGAGYQGAPIVDLSLAEQILLGDGVPTPPSLPASSQQPSCSSAAMDIASAAASAALSGLPPRQQKLSTQVPDYLSSALVGSTQSPSYASASSAISATKNRATGWGYRPRASTPRLQYSSGLGGGADTMETTVLSNLLKVSSTWMLAKNTKEACRKLLADHSQAVYDMLDVLFESRIARNAPNVFRTNRNDGFEPAVDLSSWRVSSIADMALHSLLLLLEATSHSGQDSSTGEEAGQENKHLLKLIIYHLRQRHGIRMQRLYCAPTQLFGGRSMEDQGAGALDSENVMHASPRQATGGFEPPLELSGPVAFLLAKVLGEERRRRAFVKLGGHLFVADQLQNSITACTAAAKAAMWPSSSSPSSSFSLLQRQLDTVVAGQRGEDPMLSSFPSSSAPASSNFATSPALSNLWASTICNYAPQCRVSSNTPGAYNLEALVSAAPLPATGTSRRAASRQMQQPQWTHHFTAGGGVAGSGFGGGGGFGSSPLYSDYQTSEGGKDQDWVDVVFELPYPLHLTEVVVKACSIALANGPSAVQVDTTSGVANSTPFGAPSYEWTPASPLISASGLSKIHVPIQPSSTGVSASISPVRALRLRLRRPLESNSLQLQQVSIYAHARGMPNDTAGCYGQQQQLQQSMRTARQRFTLGQWLATFHSLCATPPSVWSYAPRLPSALIGLFLSAPQVGEGGGGGAWEPGNRGGETQSELLTSVLLRIDRGACEKTGGGGGGSIVKLITEHVAGRVSLHTAHHSALSAPLGASLAELLFTLCTEDEGAALRQRQLLEGLEGIIRDVQTAQPPRLLSALLWAASCIVWTNASAKSTAPTAGGNSPSKAAQQLRSETLALCSVAGPRMLRGLAALSIGAKHTTNSDSAAAAANSTAAGWFLCSLLRVAPQLLADQLLNCYELSQQQQGEEGQNGQQLAERVFHAIGSAFQSTSAAEHLLSRGLLSKWLARGTQIIAELKINGRFNPKEKEGVVKELYSIVDCLNRLATMGSILNYFSAEPQQPSQLQPYPHSSISEVGQGWKFVVNLLELIASNELQHFSLGRATSTPRKTPPPAETGLRQSAIALVKKCLAADRCGYRRRVAVLLCELVKRCSASNNKGPGSSQVASGTAFHYPLRELIHELVLTDERVVVRLEPIISSVSQNNSTLRLAGKNFEELMLHPLFGCRHIDRIVELSLYSKCADLSPSSIQSLRPGGGSGDQLVKQTAKGGPKSVQAAKGGFGKAASIQPYYSSANAYPSTSSGAAAIVNEDPLLEDFYSPPLVYIDDDYDAYDYYDQTQQAAAMGGNYFVDYYDFGGSGFGASPLDYDYAEDYYENDEWSDDYLNFEDYFYGTAANPAMGLKKSKEKQHGDEGNSAGKDLFSVTRGKSQLHCPALGAVPLLKGEWTLGELVGRVTAATGKLPTIDDGYMGLVLKMAGSKRTEKAGESADFIEQYADHSALSTFEHFAKEGGLAELALHFPVQRTIARLGKAGELALQSTATQLSRRPPGITSQRQQRPTRAWMSKKGSSPTESGSSIAAPTQGEEWLVSEHPELVHQRTQLERAVIAALEELRWDEETGGWQGGKGAKKAEAEFMQPSSQVTTVSGGMMSGTLPSSDEGTKLPTRPPSKGRDEAAASSVSLQPAPAELAMGMEVDEEEEECGEDSDDVDDEDEDVVDDYQVDTYPADSIGLPPTLVSSAAAVAATTASTSQPVISGTIISAPTVGIVQPPMLYADTGLPGSGMGMDALSSVPSSGVGTDFEMLDWPPLPPSATTSAALGQGTTTLTTAGAGPPPAAYHFVSWVPAEAVAPDGSVALSTLLAGLTGGSAMTGDWNAAGQRRGGDFVSARLLLQPHVLLALARFLRLEGYAELLVESDRTKAKQLIRAALGIDTVGGGRTDAPIELRPCIATANSSESIPSYPAWSTANSSSSKALPKGSTTQMSLANKQKHLFYAASQQNKHLWKSGLALSSLPPPTYPPHYQQLATATNPFGLAKPGATATSSVGAMGAETATTGPLHLFPFTVLTHLFTRQSGGGDALRGDALQTGVMAMVLECLAHFSRHEQQQQQEHPESDQNHCQDDDDGKMSSSPKVSGQPPPIAIAMRDVLNAESQLEALRESLSKAASSRYQRRPPLHQPSVPSTSSTAAGSGSHEEATYWAKGTGFGHGTTTQQWNMRAHEAKRQADEEMVVAMLNIVRAYIAPQPRLSPAFVDALTPRVAGQSSCLRSIVRAQLANDSVLDISKHGQVCEAVVAVVLGLAKAEVVGMSEIEAELAEESSASTLDPFIAILIASGGGGNGNEEEVKAEIGKLVGQLKQLSSNIDTYLSRLTKGGTTAAATASDEDGKGREEDEECLERLSQLSKEASMALELKLTHLVGTAEKDQLLEGLETADAAGTGGETPIESLTDDVYCNEMKPLQFDTIPFNLPSAPSAPRLPSQPPPIPYHYAPSLSTVGQSGGGAMKRSRRLAQEIVALASSLPLSLSSSVFVRASEERLDVMKMLITGPADTPYANGCFEFDVFFPGDFPQAPMQINLETTGNHTVRFNPNLYDDGKVCLSILNTWRGRPEERWNADSSTLLQVIVSIQSLILVNDPYFNEPGYERWRGTPAGTQASRDYDANIRQQTVRWAMTETLRHPPKAFEDAVRRHFWLKRDEICDQVEGWIAELQQFVAESKAGGAGGQASGASALSHSSSGRSLPSHLAGLKRNYQQLKEELARLKPPVGLEHFRSKRFDLAEGSKDGKRGAKKGGSKGNGVKRSKEGVSSSIPMVDLPQDDEEDDWAPLLPPPPTAPLGIDDMFTYANNDEEEDADEEDVPASLQQQQMEEEDTGVTADDAKGEDEEEGSWSDEQKMGYGEDDTVTSAMTVEGSGEDGAGEPLPSEESSEYD